MTHGRAGLFSHIAVAEFEKVLDHCTQLGIFVLEGDLYLNNTVVSVDV